MFEYKTVQFESVKKPSSIEIVVSFQFEGFHYWPDASSQHTYLANAHRHMFHVKAWKEVSHGNREIEIIQFKRNMCRFATEQWGHGQMTTLSCEQMAEALCKKFELAYCEVLEDGENGAVFYNDQQNTVVHEGTESSTEIEPPKRPPKGSIFIGNECEGPKHLRGQRTLFIPASRCTVNDIKQWSHLDTRNLAIYLGAGGDIIRDGEFLPLLEKLIRDFPFKYLLIEVRSYTDLPARFEHLRSDEQGKTAVISQQFVDIQNECATYYKSVQNGIIYWVDCYGGIHTTSANDPEFSKDEVI